MNDPLENLVTDELDRVGFDLVELRRGGSRARPTLQVRLDRRDGGAVSVEDCAVASRALEARLNAEGTAGDRYVLEVSSPGVDRPLTRPSDWQRFAGRHASVLSPVLGGRQEVEIVGLEGDAGAEVAVIRTARGEEQRLPLAEVREARLAFHWKH
ncbi:MAG: ribosome maturation factor RimP [Chloroflexota bacterium]|nr:ribosome maturation factor RimP [Chloroflexota bacterium]